MKDVDVVAIQKSLFTGGEIGLQATVVEAVGAFELVDPPKYGASPYLKRRTITVVFAHFLDLVNQLENFCGDLKGFKTPGFEGFFETGSIKCLVLITHGSPGRVDINGLNRPVIDADDLLSSPVNDGMPIPPDHAYEGNLFQRLGNFLAADATVRIDGCNVANGTTGTEFLQSMSLKWPGRKIVGFVDFAAIGHDDKEHRISSVHDSEELYPNHPSSKALWWDTVTHATRSEKSPFAKIAKDGSLIKIPESEVIRVPARPIGEQVFEHLFGPPSGYPPWIR